MDSEDVRHEWAGRSGEYSPEYYAHYGPDGASESVQAAIETYLGPDPSILEIGCSSGRHLSVLQDAGYTDLTGVELNEAAREVMEEIYPDLASHGTVHYQSIETVVSEFDEAQFDVVFSVETLQHLHPESEWVFAELARITGDLLVTVENEGTDDGKRDQSVNYVDTDMPLYYRDWEEIFTELGFEAVDAKSGPRDMIRTFRHRDR